MNYASPWKRLGAGIIDYIFCSLIILSLIWAIRPALVDYAREVDYTREDLADLINGIWVLATFIYFATLESSSLQSTLGKKIFGLKVTDLQGNRIGFWKASGRFLGKYISAIILFIGFIMIFFTQKKQGLHDKMSGCVVVLNKRV